MASTTGGFLQYVLVGIPAGFLVAIASIVYPALGLPIGTAAVLATVGVALFRPFGPRWIALIAGALLGAGGMYFLGVMNTIASCVETSDFCGQANVMPALGIAVALVVLGAIEARVALRPKT